MEVNQMKFMKKSLALLFAVVLVFSLSATAFATGTDATYTDVSSVTITKNYVNSNNGQVPAADFTLEVTASTVSDSEVTTAPALTSISTASFALGGHGTGDIVITLPEYTHVGKYQYTLKEVVPTSPLAGVTYDSSEITLIVSVINGENGLVRVPVVKVGTNKDFEVTNTYDSGKLTITKEVTGAYGDKTKEFNVVVKFTGEEGKTSPTELDAVVCGEQTTITVGTEVTLKIKDGASIIVYNIPSGMSYSVEEADYSASGYTTTYTGDKTGTMGKADVTLKITNEKDGTPETGISLDSLPYVVILVVVLGGAAVLFLRKRHAED
jgi:pilin isopeptide linkage protein